MILAILSLLHACLWTTAALRAEGSDLSTLTVAAGDIVRLPCSSGGVLAPRSTTWAKNGRVIIGGGGPELRSSPAGPRLTLLPDGTLNIAEVTPGDAGSYLCNCTLQNNSSFWTQMRLRVTSDPGTLSTSIGPASALPNGTLFVFRDSDVSFNCSSSSGSTRLTWVFHGAAAANDSLLVSTVGASLAFQIAAIQPAAQGLYVCRARSSIAQQEVNASLQLLVYYAADGHPECMWTPARDPSRVLFNCTWPGTYPTPTLSWAVGGDDGGGVWKEHVYASGETDNLQLMLNGSAVSDGQKLTCAARHAALAPGTERTCTITLKPPFPDGEPLAMAQEGDSITLTCTESRSVPPAVTTWRKGLQQETIVPGFKYTLSEEGPVLRLTIHNVSRGNQGVYFCRSENLLGVRELEVYLTVRTSSAYMGVIIGLFVAAVIVASPIVFAKWLYSNRHRICLGRAVRREDEGDVMNLMESDDEQIFQDAVPPLPLPGEPQSTLVQIHGMPSGNPEDPEGSEPSPVRQEDPLQTEEPARILVF